MKRAIVKEFEVKEGSSRLTSKYGATIVIQTTNGEQLKWDTLSTKIIGRETPFKIMYEEIDGEGSLQWVKNVRLIK